MRIIMIYLSTQKYDLILFRLNLISINTLYHIPLTISVCQEMWTYLETYSSVLICHDCYAAYVVSTLFGCRGRVLLS